VHFWQVDLPDVIKQKQEDVETLKLKGNVTYVAADLSKTKLEDVLPANGFDLSQKSVVTIEGLV